MARKFLGLKGWIALSGVLIFAAGASVGFLASTFLDTDRRQLEDFAEPHVAAPDIIPETNSKVWDLLNLEEAQRAQANQILAAHLQKLKRLRDEWESLGQKVESDLLALLDEGQREQMRGIIRQIKITEVAGRVSQKLPEYKRELKLSEQQEDALYKVLLSDQVARDVYLRNVRVRRGKGEKVEHAEIMREMGKMNEERAEKLKTFLADEQLASFREIEKRRMFWGGEGRGRPSERRPPQEKPPPPPGPPCPPEAGPAPGGASPPPKA